MQRKIKPRPQDTNVLCGLCQKPLKDFELFACIGDKQKVCIRCELKLILDKKKQTL